MWKRFYLNFMDIDEIPASIAFLAAGEVTDTSMNVVWKHAFEDDDIS